MDSFPKCWPWMSTVWSSWLPTPVERISARWLRPATTVGAQGAGSDLPRECPAATRGQTLIFSSSERIDACPHLRNRPEGACSAACIPVSIAGKSIGVMHAAAPVKEPVSADVVNNLELIARKVGERVGMLRAFNKSEIQALTDPLTGLVNRRSLETMVGEIAEAVTPSLLRSEISITSRM